MKNNYVILNSNINKDFMLPEPNRVYVFPVFGWPKMTTEVSQPSKKQFICGIINELNKLA